MIFQQFMNPINKILTSVRKELFAEIQIYTTEEINLYVTRWVKSLHLRSFLDSLLNVPKCLFFQKTKSFLDAMKMHEKFFYKPSSDPKWSEERQFDNVEAFHKYANTAGNI